MFSIYGLIEVKCLMCLRRSLELAAQRISSSARRRPPLCPVQWIMLAPSALGLLGLLYLAVSVGHTVAPPPV